MRLLLAAVTLMASLVLSPGVLAREPLECPALSSAIVARQLAGKPIQWRGDFNDDGQADTLAVVSVPPRFAAPAGLILADPWNRKKPWIAKAGEPIALILSLGGKGVACSRMLLVSSYFTTPSWPEYVAGREKESPLRVIARGTAAHRAWQQQVGALKGDGIELDTAAGIDILLYLKGEKAVVFWPAEEP